MASLEIQVLDVEAEGLGDPQPVERQEGRKCVVTGRSQTGLDQEGTEFVAVEAERSGS